MTRADMTGKWRAQRVMITMVSISLAMLAIALGVLAALSPGRPKPLVDDRGRPLPDSISEKIRVPINGALQGMIIESRDPANPVLLFLHGGTGMPEYFLAKRYPTGLERHFTVCWWDRRGAGLSYAPDIPPQTITLEQAIADTLEVTRYLRARFDKPKIYLMAQSGGSMIAIQAAAQAPELYAAYIAVAQMAWQLESERLAYEYMLEQYRAAGNAAMVRRLEAAPVAAAKPLPAGYMAIRDKAMHELGVGTTRRMRSVITGVFLESWLCPAYTLGEKVGIWRGKFAMDRLLWDRMIATDLVSRVPRLELPVYFFHGRHDMTVVYSQTRSYFDKLVAPLKGFYTFEQSAHSPMFEEPERMEQIILRDVLAGRNELADQGR